MPVGIFHANDLRVEQPTESFKFSSNSRWHLSTIPNKIPSLISPTMSSSDSICRWKWNVSQTLKRVFVIRIAARTISDAVGRLFLIGFGVERKHKCDSILFVVIGKCRSNWWPIRIKKNPLKSLAQSIHNSIIQLDNHRANGSLQSDLLEHCEMSKGPRPKTINEQINTDYNCQRRRRLWQRPYGQTLWHSLGHYIIIQRNWLHNETKTVKWWWNRRNAAHIQRPLGININSKRSVGVVH